MTLVLILSLVISLVAQTQRRKREVLVHADELDRRVQSRTAELAQAVEALKSEITQHQRTAQRLQTQLERLNLLDQITRAIGERQDVRSIFQVVIRSSGRQPADRLRVRLPVRCACRRSGGQLRGRAQRSAGHGIGHDASRPTSASIRTVCRNVFAASWFTSRMSARSSFPFRNAWLASGLRAFVAAPLLFESQVFGMLIAARREPNSFSSGECEFLRQLSEHVALASHQSEVYSALQQAYDDLRQTQQAVMQQERLRALGQMASGIAHDINNAISPVALYTEMLLEQETGLSKRTREYLETTQRAIGDVAHTVARMREFYRQQEPELVLSPVDLNVLVQQVIDLTRARWSDMPQQRGIVIELRAGIGARSPAGRGYRERDSRGANQSGVQCRGCDAGRREAGHSHQSQRESGENARKWMLK